MLSCFKTRAHEFFRGLRSTYYDEDLGIDKNYFFEFNKIGGGGSFKERRQAGGF